MLPSTPASFFGTSSVCRFPLPHSNHLTPFRLSQSSQDHLSRFKRPRNPPTIRRALLLLLRSWQHPPSFHVLQPYPPHSRYFGLPFPKSSKNTSSRPSKSFHVERGRDERVGGCGRSESCEGSRVWGTRLACLRGSGGQERRRKKGLRHSVSNLLYHHHLVGPLVYGSVALLFISLFVAFILGV